MHAGILPLLAEGGLTVSSRCKGPKKFHCEDEKPWRTVTSEVPSLYHFEIK